MHGSAYHAQLTPCSTASQRAKHTTCGDEISTKCLQPATVSLHTCLPPAPLEGSSRCSSLHQQPVSGPALHRPAHPPRSRTVTAQLPCTCHTLRQPAEDMLSQCNRAYQHPAATSHARCTMQANNQDWWYKSRATMQQVPPHIPKTQGTQQPAGTAGHHWPRMHPAA